MHHTEACRGLGFWGTSHGGKQTLLSSKVKGQESSAKLAKNKAMWEFPKIRGTLLGGPYNKDPAI